MPAPAPRRWRAVPRIAFGLVVLVSLVVLFAPAGDVPPAPAGVDKLVHAGLFAALAVTGRWAGLRAPALAGLLLAYAAGSEVLQVLALPGRSGSIADAAADVVGAVAGLFLWSRLAARVLPAR